MVVQEPLLLPVHANHVAVVERQPPPQAIGVGEVIVADSTLHEIWLVAHSIGPNDDRGQRRGRPRLDDVHRTRVPAEQGIGQIRRLVPRKRPELADFPIDGYDTIANRDDGSRRVGHYSAHDCEQKLLAHNTRSVVAHSAQERAQCREHVELNLGPQPTIRRAGGTRKPAGRSLEPQRRANLGSDFATTAASAPISNHSNETSPSVAPDGCVLVSTAYPAVFCTQDGASGDFEPLAAI